MLHIVNKSPLSDSALDSCLRLAQAGSSVLLIEDAVYAASKGNVMARHLQANEKGLHFYALGPDVEARGLGGTVIDGVTLVDYGGFVDLVTGNARNQSWL